MSAAQLTAQLAAGRLVPYWGPEENLEEMLLKIQPGEIKVVPTMDHQVGYNNMTIHYCKCSAHGSHSESAQSCQLQSISTLSAAPAASLD
jgi:hypothetical protein